MKIAIDLLVLVASVGLLVLVVLYSGHVVSLIPMGARWWLRRTRPGSEPVQQALTELIQVLRRKDDRSGG